MPMIHDIFGSVTSHSIYICNFIIIWIVLILCIFQFVHFEVHAITWASSTFKSVRFLVLFCKRNEESSALIEREKNKWDSNESDISFDITFAWILCQEVIHNMQHLCQSFSRKNMTRQIKENYSSCMTQKKWFNNKSVRNAQNHNNHANYAWALGIFRMCRYVAHCTCHCPLFGTKIRYH